MTVCKRTCASWVVAAGCALLPLICVDAKPTGFQLKSGEALPPVEKNEGTTLVESSSNAYIDWEAFSIEGHERVVFQQLSDAHYVLNRVVGAEPSQILGSLHSNGAIYLINRNGVLIGPDARVETAGFLASTLDLCEEDFGAKRFAFSGTSEEAVINQGTIRCSAGDVFLIARKVENSGSVEAEQGRVGLLSGFDVVIRGDDAPQVFIRAREDDDVIDSQLFEENPYAAAIRHSGKVIANAQEGDFGGEVYLESARQLTEVLGNIEAKKGDKGGHVRVLGQNVHVLPGALIDVSGHLGGGQVLIGGDYQGKNPVIQNAKHVWAGQDTLVRADALQNGDGGKVIFWGDEATWHYGKISIQGGPLGGDGGLAEVSAKNLEYRGFTQGAAPFGLPGTLLLDPNDIAINASATTGTFSACVPPVTYNVVAGTATNNILNTDLNTQLQSCSVTITTVGSGGSGPNSGSITVSNAIGAAGAWTAATTLTLTADSFITISAAITNTSASTGFNAMVFKANGTGATTNAGITVGANLQTTGGNVLLLGTSSTAATSSHGVNFTAGTITTSSGTISVGGSVPSGPTNACIGVRLAVANAMVSTTGAINVSGVSLATGAGSHGLSIGSSWTTGTSGLVTFGSSITDGVTTIQGCQGGGSAASAGANNGIDVSAAFSTSGSVVATNLIQATGGTSSIGYNQTASFTASGTTSSITITATSNAVLGNAAGMSFQAGTMSLSNASNSTGAITLNGTGGASTTGGSLGVSLFSTGVISTAGAASISITGSARTVGIASSGVGISGVAGAVASVSGNITITGTSTANLAGSYGVSVGTWTPGTTGTITFLNCTGSNTGASHGVNFGGVTTITGTAGANALVFTNCTGGTGGANGVNVTAGAITSVGSITSGSTVGTGIVGQGSASAGFLSNQTISVTGSGSVINLSAFALGTSGACHGISLTGGTLRTTGGGSITLNGTGGASSTASHGISLTGGASTVSTTTGNGSISLTGNASGGAAASIGVSIAGSAAGVINSTSGSITITGTSSATVAGAHGVSVANTWTPATTGLVTFTGCTGGNTGASHGVNIGAALTITGTAASNGLTFTNCTGGTGGSNGVNVTTAAVTSVGNIAGTGLLGQGAAGVGFACSQTFSVSGTNSTINLTASATGTTGACHGISLTGGTVATTGGGSLTLSGTGGASSTASHGISLTGGASTVSTTTGNGSISLTGNASGGAAASVGVNINGSAAGVINSTSGSITITGTSSAAAAGAHGAAVAAAWTPATTGLVTFTGCTGGNTGASHGVNIGAALTITGTAASNGLTFINCTGGTGGSNGVNVTTAAVTSVGNIAGTGLVGRGNSGVGFACSQTFSVSGTNSTINLTASSTGTTGSCHGISLTGGTVNTTGGGSLTLSGTGGPSIGTAAHGVSLTGGSATVSTVTGNGTISITGVTTVGGDTASFGVRIAGSAADVITSTSGTITVSGTSNTAVAGSHGVSVANTWSPATTSTVTINGTGGGTGASHGISLAAALSSTGTGGAITLNGTAGGGAGSFGNSFSGFGASTRGGVITVSGSSILTANVGIDTTSAGVTPTGAAIIFSGSGATIDATASGIQGLILTSGTAGTVTFGGAIGATTRVGNLRVASARTSANAVNIGANISASTFTITTASPVTLTGTSSIDTNSTTISFGGTIDATTPGSQGLTLTTNNSTITLSGNVGATARLGSFTIGSGSGSLLIGASVTSIIANSFTVAGTVQTNLNNTATLTIDTSAFSGGSIAFGGAILGASPGSQALTLTANATGTVTFSGNVSAFTLGAILISSGSGGFVTGTGITNIGASSFTVAGTVPTTLNNTGTLLISTSSFSGGSIAFGGTINGAGAGLQPLTLTANTTGSVTLSGSIGNITRLGTITISSGISSLSIGTGVTSIIANSFTVAGTVPTTLNNTATLTIDTSAFSGGSIAFGGTIDGAGAGLQPATLTANGSGSVTLSRNVGGSTRLGAFTIGSGSGSLSIGASVTNITANSFTVAGTVPTTLNNTAALTVDTSAFSGGSIAFGGTVSGASAGLQALTLTANTTGTVTFSGNVGATRLGAILISSGGGGFATGTGITSIAANSFTVAGTVPTTLNNTGTLLINTSGSSGGSISFGGTINGAGAGLQPLTLTANTTGSVTLSGSIGGTTRLGAITISSGISSLSIGTAVTGIAANSFTVAGTVPTTLNNTATLTVDTSAFSGGSIAFGGTINGAGAGLQPLTLTANSSGSVTLSANVGGSTRLGAFTIGSGSGSLSIGASVTSITANSFTVAGTVPTTLNNTATLTVNTSAFSGGSIAFGGTVSGASAGLQALTLTANTTGTVTFSGSVGAATRLGAILISSGGGGFATGTGITSIIANSFTVAGTVPTILNNTGTLLINTSASSGGSIAFGGTIDGAGAGLQPLTLTANTTGSVTLSGSIGNTTRLGAITISSGISSLSIGTAVTGIAANSFTVAGTVPTTLNNTSTLTVDTSAFSGGSIAFGGTINGAGVGLQPLTLTANSTGSVTFSANIGGSVRLGALTIGAATGSFLVPAAVTSIAANSFTVAAVVPTTLNNTAALTINTSGNNGAIAFGGSINGVSSGLQDLTLNPGSGNITLSSSIGNTVPLGAIIFTNATNITASSSITATSVTQSTGSGTTTFNGAINLTGNLQLTGAAFTLNAPVSSANNVTIANAGLLTITAPGDIDISGSFLQSGIGLVQTAGNILTNANDIEFDSGVTLTGNINLNTGGSPGDIVFAGTLNGAYGLTLSARDITFLATLGGVTPLASLNATGTGTITVGANQTVSSGPMTYEGLVVPTNNIQFTDNGSSGITFSLPSLGSSTTVSVGDDSIVGNYNVTLVAPSSSISIEGNVDLSGTSGTAGGIFTATASTGITLEGQLLTQGGSASPGTGGDGGDVTLTASAGSISFHNINVSGGAGTVAGGDGGTILIQPASGYSGGYPIGLIVINGDLSPGADGNLVSEGGSSGGLNGSITLSANRGAASTVATITSSLPGNNISISTGTFTMGPYEVMTCLGDISISGTNLFLGDTIALSDLTILSVNLNLNLHGDQTILASNGLFYISPSLHFYGGSSYVQTGTLIPAGGALNAQDLGLSAATFRPLLLYGSHILNYDTADIPVPPTPSGPTVVTAAQKQFLTYQLLIADAELFDRLPIYRSSLPGRYKIKKRGPSTIYKNGVPKRLI